MGGDFNLQNLTIAPITSGHQFVYNMGGWFLVPLFMVEIYNVLLHKLIKRIYKNTTEWAFGALEIFAGILGNQLACMGYRQNWWLVLVRMLYFAPFYYIGASSKPLIRRFRASGILQYFLQLNWRLSIITVKYQVTYHPGAAILLKGQSCPS